MMRWFAILLLALSGSVWAGTEPAFHLCSSLVAQSMAGAHKDAGGWPVFVQLTERGSKQFEAFTSANSGRVIRLVVDGRQFARFSVVAPEGSGNLLGHFRSRDAARTWQRVLAEELPAAPCGGN